MDKFLSSDMAQKIRLKFWAGFLFLSVLSHNAFPAEKWLDRTGIGDIGIGGAFRVNYFYKDWQGRDKNGGDIDIDTARWNIDLTGDGLIGSAEYRFYPYENSDRDPHFLHHAWLGYMFSEEDQIQLGVHQVPFGILPYASHNWFFQLPYYVGLEDDYDLGIKYIHDPSPWNLQLAYYLQDEGHYHGQSVDSARYSYDLVKDGGAGNEERNQLNARLTYTFEHSPDFKSTLGFSAQGGQVYNSITEQYGTHYAAAIHLNSTYKQFNLMLQCLHYKYDLRNPLGQDESYVILGAYDFPYHAASQASIYTAGISYTVPFDSAFIDSITFYNDFSFMSKSKSGFLDTMQNVLGASIASGNFYIYCDIASGQNHPWIGADWGKSLAAGENREWHTRFNINVGFYF